MDCHQEEEVTVGNVVEFPFGNSKNDLNENKLDFGSIDQEDLNKENSVDNNLSEPPNKKPKESLPQDLMDSNPSKLIGRMFYKTKLCCKFRAGICPFLKNNCNFAHSVEELREPPPNWEKIVATLKEEQEVYNIPVVDLTDEKRESNMRLQCRDFLTEEGCLYGENCNFLHNESYKDRESVAICLVPGEGIGSKYISNTSHRKRTVCYKWELTGNCSFGSKCHFVHGAIGLPSYVTKYLSKEAINSYICATNEEATPAKAPLEGVSQLLGLPSYVTKYLSKEAINSYIRATNQEAIPAKAAVSSVGVSSLRLPSAMQNTGEIPIRRWKGPNKISKVYGDWIDEL